MKLFATSDWHFSPLTSGRVRSIAREAESEGTKDDVLVVAGDAATGLSQYGADSEWDWGFDICLEQFEGFPGKKVAVAGNHEIWVNWRQSSEQRYGELRDVYRRHGFHLLDHSPTMIDGVGFAGNIGWYDYSFRRKDSPVNETKVLIREGQLKGWEELDDNDYARLKKHADFVVVPDGDWERVRWGVTGWNDGSYVRWDYTDKEFLGMCVRKLDSHLSQIEGECDHIVAVTHHLPFKEMVTIKNEPGFDFNNAYVGSGKMGEVIRSYPKARTVLCGHTHIPGRFDIGGIRCYNVSEEGGGGLTHIEM